jgi:hypothetical protein
MAASVSRVWIWGERERLKFLGFRLSTVRDKRVGEALEERCPEKEGRKSMRRTFSTI